MTTEISTVLQDVSLKGLFFVQACFDEFSCVFFCFKLLSYYIIKTVWVNGPAHSKAVL